MFSCNSSIDILCHFSSLGFSFPCIQWKHWTSKTSSPFHVLNSESQTSIYSYIFSLNQNSFKRALSLFFCDASDHSFQHHFQQHFQDFIFTIMISYIKLSIMTSFSSYLLVLKNLHLEIFNIYPFCPTGFSLIL